jgi:hippurate hydrolase
MTDSLLDAARELLPKAVSLRRDIHMHPELGNDLPLTRARVLAEIEDLDLTIHHSTTTSGLVATLEGNRDGPIILLRGDMDALPMPEDTGLEFASRIEGHMHACGHDAHTAMLATAARLLCDRRDALPGKVKFMFQPGEEGPGGAQPMLDEGILELGGKPDAAFALHIYPNLASGVVACRPGPILACADTASIRIIGKGGHGSMPYDTLDPVPVACELVLAFQTLVSRRMRPFDPVVVTVGKLQAGTVNNVIPEFAEIEATVRTFSEDSRSAVHAGIHRLSESIAAAYEMRAEVDIESGYPATYNDAGFADFVRTTAEALVGKDAYREMPEPIMGAEDFSLVLQAYPGAFAFLGTAPPGIDPDSAPPCHSNRMMLDENAMVTGIAMHAAVATRFLGKYRKN